MKVFSIFIIFPLVVLNFVQASCLFAVYGAHAFLFELTLLDFSLFLLLFDLMQQAVLPFPFLRLHQFLPCAEAPVASLAAR